MRLILTKLTKLDQTRSNGNKSDGIEPKLNEINFDQIGSSRIKLGLIDLPKFGGGGLSPTPALSYALSSLIIEKLGLSL